MVASASPHEVASAVHVRRAPQPEPAARHLRQRVFGASTTRSRSRSSALDGVDLEVAPGEFFGLLGPNGAGKTTLIKILTTLLLPTSGEARIFGFDVVTETRRIRRIMNMVAGGEQSGYGILTVREQLWMFSQFYGLGTREGWTRTDQMIEAVGLHDQRLQRVSTLSTGQRQKLNMARGLLNDPWILFLDEPTLGLDVAAARTIRELVLEWKGAIAGTDGPAHDPLPGRGRRAVRADRDRRPRPDPRDRLARRAQAPRPARVDLPARARPARWRRRCPRADPRAWCPPRRPPTPTRRRSGSP